MAGRDEGSWAQERALSPLVFTTLVEHRQVNVLSVYIVAFRLCMYIFPLSHASQPLAAPALPFTLY